MMPIRRFLLRSQLRIIPTLWLVLALFPAPVTANGGRIRVDEERLGPYLVSVFTEPVPLRVGTIDVSVLVEDPASGEVVDQALAITVAAQEIDATTPSATHTATREQASQPERYRSAVFDIQPDGRWRFTVSVDGPDGGGQTQFDADVSGESIFSQRNQIIVAVILAPIIIGLFWWLFFAGDDDEPDKREIDSDSNQEQTP